MSQYECAVILLPTLADEQIQQHIEMVKSWIVGVGAQVTAVDVWGRKRLAYAIRKQQEGFYIIYYFTLDQGRERLGEIERRVHTTEAILRHMVVRLPVLKEAPRLPSEEEEGEGGGGEPAAAPGEPAAAAAVPGEPAPVAEAKEAGPEAPAPAAAPAATPELAAETPPAPAE